MTTISQQIESAISVIANRPYAFSASDVAVYADMEELEGSIEDVLSLQSKRHPTQIVDVGHSNPTDGTRYLGVAWARRWWIESTLRWFKADFDHVTSTQLAHSMSAALDTRIWDAPSQSMLNIGHELSMVAHGCIPGTFVFPWVSFLRFGPQFTDVFRKLFRVEDPFPSLDLSIFGGAESEGMLNTLNSRESSVIQLRFGLEDGRRHTLEEIGHLFGVTRERIRQIEAKALRKLRGSRGSRGWRLQLRFATEFMRSGGSLLIPESQMAPEISLLVEVLGLNIAPIKELGVNIITTMDLSEYRAYLYDDDGYQSGYNPQRLAKMLPFLSKCDAERVFIAEEEYWNRRASERWTRPRMILEALRAIGRAAHYQEIAEKCNELFPDSQTTTHNWYGALSRENNMEELGIVWVGRRGMYGLKEQGYVRPSMDLYDAVPAIVEREYSKMLQPVSEQVVITELRKDRRELNLNSVKMVLAFSDRLDLVGPGRYIPRTPGPSRSDKLPGSDFDISAAFEAFSEEDAD